MKTTWAKREYSRSGSDFRARVDGLHESIKARYAAEFPKAGVFRRMILRYQIAAEFDREMTKEVEMSTPPKASTSDRLLGLLIFTGFMLLISTLPIGILTCLQDHFQSHSDWHWAFALGTVMAVAVAVVGSVLFCIGTLVVIRRRKLQ